MKTMPLSIRLDKKLRSLLVEGARRTPFNQRELLRRTLHLHLREVIEREAAPPEARITNIEPWPRGCLAKAYRQMDPAWDRLETAARACCPSRSVACCPNGPAGKPTRRVGRG